MLNIVADIKGTRLEHMGLRPMDSVRCIAEKAGSIRRDALTVNKCNRLACVVEHANPCHPEFPCVEGHLATVTEEGLLVFYVDNALIDLADELVQPVCFP